MAIGAVILLAVGFVYGFTEIHVSKTMCALIWSVCIFVGRALLDKIEMHK